MANKVLVLADYYVPVCEATGPVSSLMSVMKALSGAKNFHLITRFKGKKIKHAPNNIQPDKWINRDECLIYYNRNNLSCLKSIWACAKSDEYITLYCNSFFSFFYSILPLLVFKLFANRSKINIIISPRGELSCDALSIKPFRKQSYLVFSSLAGLHQRVTWHVTSDAEKKDLLKIIPNAKTYVIPNIVSYNCLHEVNLQKFNDKVKILFVSRIVKIKNLLTAIKSMNQVKADIVFDIYGPIEDDRYWDECYQQIKLLPDNIHCEYNGVIDKNCVKETMNEYQILLAPSQSENFGHVLVEAMSQGLMLIIGPNTPWSKLGELNIGYVVDHNSPTSIANVINAYISLTRKQKIETSNGVLNYFRDNFDNSDSIKEMKRLLGLSDR